MISTVEGSGSSGNESSMDVISSTGKVALKPMYSVKNQGNAQFTVLLSPLRDSLSHFKKSCEGGTGDSSAFGAVPFGGADGRGETTLDGATRVVTEDADATDVEEVLGITLFETELVTTGRGDVATTAEVLPPAATVVQAPPKG